MGRVEGGRGLEMCLGEESGRRVAALVDESRESFMAVREGHREVEGAGRSKQPSLEALSVHGRRVRDHVVVVVVTTKYRST